MSPLSTSVVRTAAVLAVLVIQAGCAARGTLEFGRGDGLVWPVDEPRIRLVQVIDLDDVGKGRLAWLGHDEPRFQRPYGVAWDGDDLLVADPAAGRVARIRPGGRIELSAAGQFIRPVGIAVCPGGIVVTDAQAGRVERFTDRLRFSATLADGLARPTGVACDQENTYVVETGAHRILVLGPGGTRRTLGGRGANAGQFNFPTSVVVDGDALLIGDTLNFRVQRIDATSGEPIAVFGRLGDAPGETPRIKGVAVDGYGQIWVADGYLDRVSLYSREGTLLMSLGERGAAPGEFSFPAGIAVHADGKRVAVVDSLNRRIQVFTLLERAAADGTDGT